MGELHTHDIKPQWRTAAQPCSLRTMSESVLEGWHQSLGAAFRAINGSRVVSHYGGPGREYEALTVAAGLFDLSPRGRLCLIGADRERFLNGQVTNQIKSLRVGEGCYALLTTAKGKLRSDANIFRLDNEFLLDLEPGLGAAVTKRLEEYVIADDVQVVDAGDHYGLLSVQGPLAAAAIEVAALSADLPLRPLTLVQVKHEILGELYLANQPRVGFPGYEVYVPQAALPELARRLLAAVQGLGGRACGWEALETARIEAGIPRFGADMDETNLPAEAGIEARAVSYAKGCYIGQEVIARMRTYGQATKQLCGLRWQQEPGELPVRGDKLFKADKEVGMITSAIRSPRLAAVLALGYVRKEVRALGAELTLRTAAGESMVRVVETPFVAS